MIVELYPYDLRLLEDELHESALERFNVKAVGKSDKVYKRSDLEGVMLQHPFYNKQVPVIMGEHVTTETGTGAVHTSPSHGQDDYVVGLKYDLPLDCPVDGKGVFIETTEHVAGEFIFKANTTIIELLKKKDTLVNHTPMTHSYPHCWRHKTPLMFRATPQWFIGMSEGSLLNKAKKAISKVNWEPSWGETRMASMLDRPDWCISRQRAWGVPIPLLIHKETREVHPDTDKLIEQIAKNIEEQGLEYWYEVKIEDLIKDPESYEKITDILDV